MSIQIIFFYSFANFKNLVTSKGKVDRGGGGESGGGEGGGITSASDWPVFSLTPL